MYIGQSDRHPFVVRQRLAGRTSMEAGEREVGVPHSIKDTVLGQNESEDQILEASSCRIACDSVDVRASVM